MIKSTKREWLIKYRKDKGYTFSYIANQLGITKQYYSYIENGERRPSPELAKKISDLFGFYWGKFYENSQEEGG